DAVDQRRLRIRCDFVQRLIALLVLLIGQVDLDPAVGDLRHFGLRVVRDRHVDRARAGMKQIERPEIESSTGKIGAHRRAAGNLVHWWMCRLKSRRAPGVWMWILPLAGCSRRVSRRASPRSGGIVQSVLQAVDPERWISASADRATSRCWTRGNRDAGRSPA